jgi:aminoglycoside 3-N-acetyltransferase
MRNFLRKITPAFLLDAYRRSKKQSREKQLTKDKELGDIITEERLIDDLRAAGISQGDIVLVHSSLSKLGYVENGPKTVVDALLKVIGSEGHLLMPNSPNAGLQLEYIRSKKVFDVENDESALGSITEYFRKLPGAIRSAHPTEPVSCIGPDAEYFVQDHFGELTPYTSRSPFYRVSEKGGKILYMGVTFDNAGTNLHTLEDAVDFKYPVYFDEKFDVEMVFSDGQTKTMTTKVHNPEQSAKRKCDGLIPLFENKGILAKVKIGKADTLVVDAKAMLDCMIEEYNERGVTMYTPEGE